MRNKDNNNGLLGAMIVGALFALVFCLTVAYFTNDSCESIIRSNEQLRYENAQLQSANDRLLEELGEGLIRWEDVEE